MLDGTSDGACVGAGVGGGVEPCAAYVATKPAACTLSSLVNRMNIFPVGEVIGDGTFEPVNDPSSVPLAEVPAYTFTKS